MSISITQYTAIRNRLLKLYNILQNRMFDIVITPAMTMSMDELRDRETITRDDSIGDDLFFEDYQCRQMTVWAFYNILQFVVKEDDVGFKDPNVTVVQIYESIQEYIQLWVEIVVNTTEFRCPAMEELRALESVAFFLFPTYRKVRKYNEAKDMYASKKEVVDMSNSLLPLLKLFGISSGEYGSKDNIHFISHLDHLLSNSSPLYGSLEQEVAQVESKPVSDSLFSAPPPRPTDLPSWNFDKG